MQKNNYSAAWNLDNTAVNLDSVDYSSSTAKKYNFQDFTREENKEPSRLYVATTQDRAEIKRKRYRAFKNGVIACLFLILVSTVVFLQSTSNMLTGDILKQEEEILLLESQEQYLVNYIEMQTNLSEVEEYAKTQLGMVEQSSSQVVYVYRDSQGSIVREKTTFEKMFDLISKNYLQYSAYLLPEK